MLQYV